MVVDEEERRVEKPLWLLVLAEEDREPVAVVVREVFSSIDPRLTV